MDRMIMHNHPLLEPENGELYHPESDPRKLEDTCPACKEIMISWRLKCQQLQNEGA